MRLPRWTDGKISKCAIWSPAVMLHSTKEGTRRSTLGNQGSLGIWPQGEICLTYTNKDLFLITIRRKLGYGLLCLGRAYALSIGRFV
jgi:hypothetical protein